MKEFLKRLVKNTPVYHSLRNVVLKGRYLKELAEWERSGRGVPPPHLVKQRILLNYARAFNLRVLVETGTYYGDMVEAMKRSFDQIYSIELSRSLFELAQERFRRDVRVKLLHGDSATELGRIMSRLDRPALFWLDGHFSGGVTASGRKATPIEEELNHILSAEDLGHVIVIDDARCFGSDAAYPTLDALREFISSRRPTAYVEVSDDTIRITSSAPTNRSEVDAVH